MAIKELNHINIRTDKMEETKDFFVDVVGLSIGWRPDFDSHGYWLYCGEVPIVHLSLSDPAGDPRTVASGRGEGLDHIGLSAKDHWPSALKRKCRGGHRDTEHEAKQAHAQVRR